MSLQPKSYLNQKLNEFGVKYQLGKGAYAVVYAAEDLQGISGHKNKLVALKIPSDQGKSYKKQLAEADHDAGAGKRADHPQGEAAQHRGPADEPPALPDGFGDRRHRDLAAELPLRDLADGKDGQGGDRVGGGVDV